MADEHDLPLEEYHRAGLEITNGNPDVYKGLYSRAGDVTLANPFGPPAVGWGEVSATLDRAAANYRDGEVVGFENASTVITRDLAYTVEIESYRARVGGVGACARRVTRDDRVSARGRHVEGDAQVRRSDHVVTAGGIGGPGLKPRCG